MSKRWFRWVMAAVVATLLAWSGWRLSVEFPERLRKVEVELASAAAGYGLDVSHGGLRFHLLHLFLSLDNVVVRDIAADRFLARAGHVEVSLSPVRLLKREIPVSRVRVRNFRVEAGEWNRVLYDRITSSGGKKERTSLPEVLFVDGSVSLGPLGPVRLLRADVQELRIREGRFLGTRIHASIAHASGELSVPGQGTAAWPYPSIEADLVAKGDVIKVRRARAWGGPSKIRLSGFLETGKRLLEGEASGEVDLAKWIAGNHPGASFVRRAFHKGRIEFSASAAGPWNNPEGTARAFLRGGDFLGAAVSEASAALTARGRVVRLDRARAKVGGGTVEASGSFDVDASRAELAMQFDRFPLVAVPWADLGVPFRLSGAADLAASVSGTLDRLGAKASLSVPRGIEYLPSPGKAGFKVPLPLSGDVSAAISGTREWRLDSVHLKAGAAELAAAGEIRPAAREVRLSGTVRAPSGKAGEYGLAVPVSWKELSGGWSIAGPADRLRATAAIDVQGLAAWSLPPVPLTARAEGSPADAIRFTAGIPSDAFRLSAAGTVTAPLQAERRHAGVSVSVREIDLSDSGRWAAAVLASLGEDPSGMREYFDGSRGRAEADGTFAMSPGQFEFRGSVRSQAMVVRGIPLTSVEAEAEYGRTAADRRWEVRGQGKLGDGIVRGSAKASPGARAEASADVSGLRISQALALLKRGGGIGVDGVVDLRVDAREGPGGWELPRVTASSKELSVRSARIEGVRAEGSLGPVTGAFSIGSASPRMSLSGDLRRGGEWPASVVFLARALPTSFLLAAAGHPDPASGGTWSAEAKGVVHLAALSEGRPVGPEAFPSLVGTVRAEEPAAGAVRFREVDASGKRQGDVLAGELVTGGPDTRLAWELSLREPFAFRVEGPFSVGETPNGIPKDGRRRFSVRGDARIAGELRALDRTTGTIRIDSLTYREGGWELSGRGIAAALDAEGIRWKGGTLAAGGSPVNIVGKASWKGDIDARIEGKLPAGLVRLAVPDVFDRIDGIATIDVRVTGNRSDPVIVGTGRLEGGTLSFLGYAQLFEGLRADAVLTREKIVFERFEGRSGGGYIDGWGEVPLRMDAGQRMYFSTDFFDMRYPYPEDFRPVVQGHIELLGPVDNLLATGEVEVQSARYTKNLYPEKALLDFRRRLADVSARREESEFRVRLDIDVTADRTIRIRNNIMDATASGDFKVQGDSGKVVILGSFDVYEGFVEFYGNKYELKRVILDFQDPRRNNPRLDVRAETTKGDYSVAVLVSGTLDRPEVDFSSDPPLGRTDIVSLLSFGVTTQTLLTPGTRSTTDRNGTIGGAAIAIGSFAGGVDETIRSAAGLDKFSIETGFSQTTQTFEPRLVARKSFEDRLTVTMSQTLGTTSETAASGEVRLLKNVYLEGGWESATKSTEGQISGDLKVRYRFPSFRGLLHGRD